MSLEIFIINFLSTAVWFKKVFTETDQDLYRSKSIFRNDTFGFKFLTFIYYSKLKFDRFY